MPGFEHGLKRAITEVITGITTAAIVNAFASSGFIPAGYLLLINLANGAATAALFLAFPYWATTYMLGWGLGMYFMLTSGLLTIWDIIGYLLCPIIIIAIRIRELFSENQGGF